MLSLDGDEPLHVPTLPQDMRKPPLMVLGDVDGEELADAEPGAQEGGNERMVPESLGGAAAYPGTEGLGRATTATVVHCTMGVIVSDFFLTKLMLMLFW